MTAAVPDLNGDGLRIGVVWSRFNEDIVRELVTACDKQLLDLGVAAGDIHVASVPGALEIPLALQALALGRRGFGRRFDALVALGAIIRGETYHFEIVANESARGILDVQLETLADRKWDEVSPIERAILLIGAWELMHRPEIPYRATLNEAIELGKRFGGTEGHKYVNGVLDKLAKSVRADEVAAPRNKKADA